MDTIIKCHKDLVDLKEFHKNYGKSLIPNEGILFGIKEPDHKGVSGGTEYYCNLTFYFKITEDKKDVIKRISEAVSIQYNNLINR